MMGRMMRACDTRPGCLPSWQSVAAFVVVLIGAWSAAYVLSGLVFAAIERTADLVLMAGGGR